MDYYLKKECILVHNYEDIEPLLSSLSISNDYPDIENHFMTA